MFSAAFKSLSNSEPQTGQVHSLSSKVKSSLMNLHLLQVLEEGKNLSDYETKLLDNEHMIDDMLAFESSLGF